MAVTASDIVTAANDAGLDTPAKIGAAFKALAAQAEVIRLQSIAGRIRKDLRDTEAQLAAAESARDTALGGGR